MIKLGLTGSLGSGKSTVAGMSAEEGARVIDADQLARQAVEPGSPAYQEILEAFGAAVLKPDGRLDRAALARQAFHDPVKRRRLEAIVHPRVRDEQRRLIRGMAPGDIVALDVPLLFESGLDRECDLTCVVLLSDERRLERLAARGLSAEEVRLRLAAQMPQEEKALRADCTIDNSGRLEQTRRQAGRLMKRLKILAGSEEPPKERESCPRKK